MPVQECTVPYLTFAQFLSHSKNAAFPKKGRNYLLTLFRKTVAVYNSNPKGRRCDVVNKNAALLVLVHDGLNTEITVFGRIKENRLLHFRTFT